MATKTLEVIRLDRRMGDGGSLWREIVLAEPGRTVPAMMIRLPSYHASRFSLGMRLAVTMEPLAHATRQPPRR